jgi:hypothetical protein
MPEQPGKLVEIAAGHHVPGCESVAQVVEAEISNLRSFEQFMETLVRTLTSGGKIRSSPRTAGYLLISSASSGGMGI